MAEEIAQLEDDPGAINDLTLAMNARLTVDAVIASVHAYPTYSFALPAALYEQATGDRPGPALRLGRIPCCGRFSTRPAR